MKIIFHSFCDKESEKMSIFSESSDILQKMDDISGAGGDGNNESVVAAKKSCKLFVHNITFCAEDLVIR